MLSVTVYSQTVDSVSVRIVTYNTLGLGAPLSSIRRIDAKHVIDGTQPNVIVLQDIIDSLTVTLLTGTYVNTPAPTPFLLQTHNALLYDSTVISYIDELVIPIGNNFASQWRLIVRATGDTIAVFGCNFHRGQDSASQEMRNIEAQALRYHIHSISLPKFIIAGTLYSYSSDDIAFRWLVEDRPFGDSIIRGQAFDPISSLGVWHDNGNFAKLHTSSTRITARSGGAGGGMIDRFDFVLLSKSLFESSYIPDSYTVLFNLGKSFRDSIRSQSPSYPLLENAQNASDHLPVILDLVFRSRVSSVRPNIAVPLELNLTFWSPVVTRESIPIPMSLFRVENYEFSNEGELNSR